MGKTVENVHMGGAAASPFHVYKPGQGAAVRWGTAVGLAAVIIGFGAFLREELTRVQNQWIEYLVPAAVIVLLGYLAFYLVGQYRPFVDFLIATEAEMKKVNWSSRREVIGATKVVIITVLALGSLLFVVNVVFMFLFESIGVLRSGLTAQLFGGGQ